MKKTANIPDFDRFWSAYPRRVNKKDAQKAWIQVQPDAATVTNILAALVWQVKQAQWQKDDGQYVPYPGSWLRNERWTDEPPVSMVLQTIEFWFDECKRVHDGTCSKHWAHQMRMRDEDERQRA